MRAARYIDAMRKSSGRFNAISFPAKVNTTASAAIPAPLRRSSEPAGVSRARRNHCRRSAAIDRSDRRRCRNGGSRVAFADGEERVKRSQQARIHESFGRSTPRAARGEIGTPRTITGTPAPGGANRLPMRQQVPAVDDDRVGRPSESVARAAACRSREAIDAGTRGDVQPSNDSRQGKDVPFERRRSPPAPRQRRSDARRKCGDRSPPPARDTGAWY